MATRITDEERVVSFFNTADVAKVETIFNVVKGIVKSRTAKPRSEKPTRKARASQPASSTSTEAAA